MSSDLLEHITSFRKTSIDASNYGYDGDSPWAPITIIIDHAQNRASQYNFGTISDFEKWFDETTRVRWGLWKIFIEGERFDSPKPESSRRDVIDHVAYCVDLHRAFFDE